MRPFIFALPTAAILTAGLSLPLYAMAEVPDGPTLYQDHCTKCHGSEIYTRADRKIRTLDALHSQVRLCEQNLGLKWFDDEIDNVATLLNQEYYKFSN